MRDNRLELYKKLETKRSTHVILYATSDRLGLETSIAPDILPLFSNHLDAIGDVDKISLVLYTRGGHTLTAWSLVNLIRNFCKNFEIIVPFHCHSAGTLICLGADRIVMTKQATLGPIDPSVNSPMNPVVSVNDQQIQVPVNVEFINGYLEMAKTEFGITDQNALAAILDNLSNKIHPLVLGHVQRTRVQIQMLARKLLKHQSIDSQRQDEIIKFLCKESGSHDYTIYRKEARDDLGLNIEKPDDELYDIIKAIYNDIKQEMELDIPFVPALLLAKSNPCQYSFHRVIIESFDVGSDVFISEGQMSKQLLPPQPVQGLLQPQFLIHDNRTFDGWRHL
jgi:hypothetical protein